MTVLVAEDVSKRFAGVQALTEATVEILEGRVTGVIGPNGSGKSTLFNVLAGTLRPTSGRVRYRGADVTRLPQFARVRRGLVRTFQEASSFPALTVRENLRIAGRASRRAVDPAEVVALCGLAGDEARTAGALPYGRSKLLGIALSLMTGPDVLLLDEPAAGISASETDALSETIRAVHAAGTTVALIDHNVGFIMPLADRVYALDAGQVLTHGTPDEVLGHADVIGSYLGTPR